MVLIGRERSEPWGDAKRPLDRACSICRSGPRASAHAVHARCPHVVWSAMSSELRCGLWAGTVLGDIRSPRGAAQLTRPDGAERQRGATPLSPRPRARGCTQVHSDQEALMSTPTVDEPARQQTQSEHPRRAVDADRLRQGAAAVRRARPHPDRSPEAHAESRSTAARQRVIPLRDLREDETSARRTLNPKTGKAPHRRELESVQERADRVRAERALAQVRDPRWWDRASAGDLEQARLAASASGVAPGNRAAIRNEMREVAQRRYGTSVDGAILYERENPRQPPPDRCFVGGRALT